MTRPAPMAGGAQPGGAAEDGRAVRVDVSEGVALLSLDRPESGNALTPAVLRDLAAAVSGLREAPGVRAVVLTGAGRDFCLGGSLGDLERLAGDVRAAEGRPDEESLAPLRALAEAVLGLAALECPVIAAVNGQAAGAGFSLALACDLRIASEKAAFHFAYGMLGCSTDGAMSWFLPRVVGPAQALSLLLEQPVLRAPAALRTGLVSAVVPPDDLVSVALRRAHALARTAPHSVRTAKRLVSRSLSLPLADHLRLEHDCFIRGLMTEDVQRELSARQPGNQPERHRN
ncbi:hypothetical protein A6A06_14515 [Streptomyces sp. CB02923]|uniref:enoyl-CoA hydratase/isomerase family protein n=1 Tax=Streptomyces sp. CB02923 TaxID=1718985 RepID=UPI000962B157|nr:enoyl-CoA hydratase-related protein [Streptomyces sp. CB02923]OKI02267.1 hypothetical protein A6A06_14515 [Streptomyces sp. CB02923]